MVIVLDTVFREILVLNGWYMPTVEVKVERKEKKTHERRSGISVTKKKSVTNWRSCQDMQNVNIVEKEKAASVTRTTCAASGSSQRY